jgi:dihydroxyacetone kinase-like protein
VYKEERVAMKKFINQTENVVSETFAGLLAVHGDKFYQVEDVNAIAKKEMTEKVAIVTGGGSGHEPIWLEYIGGSFADAVCEGSIFAAPSPDIIVKGTKAVDQGKGVVFVYSSYSGDILNFDMAAELLEMEGIETRTVQVTDDVAAAPIERMSDRRGIAGGFFVMKIAGAASESGLSLDEVHRVALKAVQHVRSIGVASGPGTIPGVNESTFELPDGEMEMGMGMHGEPGVRRTKMMSADETVDEMLTLLIEDLPFRRGDKVCVLVNGLGATTRLELYIATRRVKERLFEEGIGIHDIQVGNYATCQEMHGFSISLLKLDEELQSYYNVPAWTPFYNNLKMK